jgi:hypothetical protein
MPQEIQIYLAKFMHNPMRGEPRNVGLLVRTSSDELLSRFLLEGDETQAVPKTMNLIEYGRAVGEWRTGFAKYGIKGLHFVGKRKSRDQKFYIEMVGGMMVDELDFDKMFKELVL